MEILHFNSQKERLAYIKGEFEEIKPLEVIPQVIEEIASESVKKASETISDEQKPKKKTKKGKKKDGEVQA